MKTINILLQKQIRTLTIVAAIVVLVLLPFAGCKDFSFFNELGVKSGLTITPASVSILTGGTMSFSAHGGNGDYVFSIISGCGGTIDPASGVYTAAASECTEVVMVTDGTNLSTTANVSVVTTLDELEINPKVATLSPGGSITFMATGGVQPYTFGFNTNNSGGGLTSGGVYTAGPITGTTDSIIVTDSDSTVCVVPASVSVVVATTNVNYSVSGDTFPASADAGTGLSGDFTVINSGTGNGSKPVSWWLYLSEDGSFGGDGETLIASNSTSALDSGLDSDVTPGGNWPASGGTFTIFIMVSAEDDMTHSDNIYNAGSINLTVPDVDYDILSVTNLDPTPMIGEEVDGQFRLQNIGSDDGGQTIEWEVWLSADGSIGVGDTQLYSDPNAAALNTLETADIDFNTTGFWPASPGSYYLIARVISSEDSAAGNDGNNEMSLGSIAVTAPTVDYYLTAVEHHGATEKVPGNSFDARFRYANDPAADDGISDLGWIAYVSLDASLGPEDILVASGSGLGPMNAGTSSGWINFSGTWPLHYGNYNIIVAVSSPDNETDLTDNESASAPVSIGYYGEIAPTNDNWQDLPGPSPGTDYDILTGVDPAQPIALEPGMTLLIQGTNLSNTDRDDVFMINTGTAEKITFTVTWDTGGADIDLYLWRQPGNFPQVIEVLNNTPNTLSLSINRGPLWEQFVPGEDLWFNLFCNFADPPPPLNLGPYEVVITAE